MQPLPERQLEFLQFLKKQPTWITGPLHMRGVNGLLAYLVHELGPSVSAVHFLLEEENQVTMVAKNVDAVAFEDIMYEQQRVFFHLMLIPLCEAVTIRVDHFLLQAFQGECTYSVVEDTTRAELTTKFKFRKDLLNQYNLDFSYLSYGGQQLAYLTPGLRVTIEQAYGDRQRNMYCYPKGVLDYMDYELNLKGSYYLYTFSRNYMEGDIDGNYYRIGMCFGDTAQFRTFANYHELKSGGALEEGVLKGLMMGIQEIAREEEMAIVIGKSLLLKRLYCIVAVEGPGFNYNERDEPGFVLDMPELEEAVSRFVCREVLQMEEGERVEMVKLFEKEG